MRFPNAFQGVSKICKAVLLLIVAAILSAIAGITGLIGEGAVLIGAVALIAACVLMIIALIMKISGVNRASKDELFFKKALYVLVGGIIFSVVAGIFSKSKLITGLCSFGDNICELLAAVCICTGVLNLAGQLQDKAMMAEAVKTRVTMVGIWGVGAFLSLLMVIFSKSTGFVNVLSVASPVISIVAYIVYYGMLKKAKAMLEK